MEKQYLEQLVKDCNSFSEILKKQGKSVSGTAVKILKDKLDLYQIPYHFIQEKNCNRQKSSIEELLIENSTYQSSKLKIRLIEEGIKEDVCEICGQKNSWNGKPLILHLDHINGNHFDNRLENLRILCPNCHSQTETFGNKRSKKRNTCVDCGKEISNKSTRCLVCSAKHVAKEKTSNKIYPTKDELLKLILTKSFVEIGKMYGVKDNAIRKWCKKFGLPYRKQDIKKLYFNNGRLV